MDLSVESSQADLCGLFLPFDSVDEVHSSVELGSDAIEYLFLLVIPELDLGVSLSSFFQLSIAFFNNLLVVPGNIEKGC